MEKNNVNEEGIEDMSAFIESKPIKSTELHFKSDQELKEFENFIKNPPAPSEFLKELLKEYKKQGEDCQ